MDRTFKQAVEILHSRKRPARPKEVADRNQIAPDLIPSIHGESELKGTSSSSLMKQWLQLLGYSSRDFNKLNIIHVAGTKGKGSTCAFIDSLLRAHGRRTGFPAKVGLYTSPHLLSDEERIRINFQPVSKDKVAANFFELDDAIATSLPPGSVDRPRYLQSFLLLALLTFIKEGVDTAIIETHHGGEFDSTNIFDKPVVTAITSLGMDHIAQLGPSIENIAWHKAGIMKHGAAAFSSPQESGAADMLRKRAEEKDVKLVFTGIDPGLPQGLEQISPTVQRVNAALAVAVVQSFLDQKASLECRKLTTDDIVTGLNQFKWPGRFQIVLQEPFQWFLDSAHNEMSVGKAAEWYIEVAETQRKTEHVIRAMIFSMETDQRDPRAVFECLASSLKNSGIQHVIITTYRINDEVVTHDVQQQRKLDIPTPEEYTKVLDACIPATTVYFKPTITEALEVVYAIGRVHGTIQTLVTGSQYLVGGILLLLHQNERTSASNSAATSYGEDS